ncbi:MAG: hypothetical protein WAV76_12920 [Bacteroidota bacterium]
MSRFYYRTVSRKDDAYLKNLFPKAQSILAKNRLQTVHKKEYLISGIINEWKGVTRKVYSPSCVSEEESLL